MSIKFDIITIFPKIVEAYVSESILKRAREKKIIEIKIHDLKKFSINKHRKIDDKPYSGGPGMVMSVEPLANCIRKLLDNKKSKAHIILFSAAGKQFNSQMAARYVKFKHIILIAGHYEGIDERVKQIFKAEEISIGNYVLTGGELPAMVMVDAISRHIPGVLGKNESLEEKRYGIGVPVYTRPEIFKYKNKKYAVPKILLSGDHKKIEDWRKNNRKT